MSRPNLWHSGFPEIEIRIGWLSEGSEAFRTM